jgi:hypothetical protein
MQMKRNEQKVRWVTSKKLATDETRMKHGYEEDKGRRQYQIRVSSVFHPWLRKIHTSQQVGATLWYERD